MSRSVATLIDRGRLVRAWPFAAIAAVAQISAIWPPGPSNNGLFWFSTALLVLDALLLFVRVPDGVSPLLLAASVNAVAVTCLLLATGGTASGFAPLYLIAVVGVSLFGSRRDSTLVVSLVLIGLFVVSIQGGEPALATGGASAWSPASVACSRCRSMPCACGSWSPSGTRSSCFIRLNPSTQQRAGCPLCSNPTPSPRSAPSWPRRLRHPQVVP